MSGYSAAGHIFIQTKGSNAFQILAFFLFNLMIKCLKKKKSSHLLEYFIVLYVYILIIKM